MEVLTCNTPLIPAHSIKTEPESDIRHEIECIPDFYGNHLPSKDAVKLEPPEKYGYNGNLDNYEHSLREEIYSTPQENGDSYETSYEQQTYEYKEPEENFISVDDLKVEILFPNKNEDEGRPMPPLVKIEQPLGSAKEVEEEDDDEMFLENDSNYVENEPGVEVDWPDLENARQDFECFLCNKKVSSNYNLRRHMMIHTGERPFGCDICLKRFREFSDLKKHRRTHIDDEGYKCLICHRNPPSEKNATKCDSCGQDEKQHKIPYGSVYLDESVIMQGSHNKTFVCPSCDRIFGSRHNLKRHYMIHTGEKPYQCDLCEKRFREVSTLKKHTLTHSRINVFNCAICGAQFTDFRSYKCHKNAHFGKKKSSKSRGMLLSTLNQEDCIDYLFKCRECPEKFPNLASYKQHLKVHSPDETFHCNICGIVYRSREKLQAHFITHSSSTEEDQSVDFHSLLLTHSELLKKKNPRELK